MDIQRVIFHSSSCSSPGGRKKWVLQTFLTAIQTGARYTDASCLPFVHNILRNYCERCEIQYNLFSRVACTVLCLRYGVTSLERVGKATCRFPSISSILWSGLRFPNDRKENETRIILVNWLVRKRRKHVRLPLGYRIKFHLPFNNINP